MVMINVNCIYNDKSAWCKHKGIKKSMFGIGARVCVEVDGKQCTLKQTHPRPDVLPPAQMRKY